jgi:hypothetical protein
MTLASIWLALVIVSASAGAARPSADDSRLPPSGMAAHLWLLPKAGHRTASRVLPSLRANGGITRAFASSRNGAEPFAALCHAREPLSIPQRRLPPPRASSDPPLAF